MTFTFTELRVVRDRDMITKGTPSPPYWGGDSTEESGTDSSMLRHRKKNYDLK